ncbi:MAG: hypothetical protein JWQ69_1525 [Pseudomonas sp.]|nr:hypothetical protein [Pseudomonas sp.]
MNSNRCLGLLLVMVLSACDAQETPAPTPKVTGLPAAVLAAEPVAAAPVSAPSTVLAPAPQPAPFKELAREPVHELLPNVAVVPVTVAQQPHSPAKKTVAVKATTSKAVADKGKSGATVDKSRAPIASKTKSPAQVVQDTHLVKPSIDLTLPNEMASQIDPQGKVTPIAKKSVLPSMFAEKKTAKDTPFQLNGRLLSNEMQLQLRNESHQQVEGAALDFEFRQ